MKKDNQILEIFRQNKGYARTKDILEAGVHHHYLEMLVQEGKVVKIKRGLYRLASVSVDDELEEVSHIVPNGVVCLFSAWNYYQLSEGFFAVHRLPRNLSTPGQLLKNRIIVPFLPISQ